MSRVIRMLLFERIGALIVNTIAISVVGTSIVFSVVIPRDITSSLWSSRPGATPRSVCRLIFHSSYLFLLSSLQNFSSYFAGALCLTIGQLLVAQRADKQDSEKNKTRAYGNGTILGRDLPCFVCFSCARRFGGDFSFDADWLSVYLCARCSIAAAV